MHLQKCLWLQKKNQILNVIWLKEQWQSPEGPNPLTQAEKEWELPEKEVLRESKEKRCEYVRHFASLRGSRHGVPIKKECFFKIILGMERVIQR